MAKILVIDDEPEIRFLIKRVLGEAGHEIVEAEDGEAGLKMLENHKPDLILLDIMLPGMNGWEVCERIKADRNLKKIPLAMFSVRNGSDDLAKSLRCRADMHIPKHAERAWLLDAVNALLEHRK